MVILNNFDTKKNWKTIKTKKEINLFYDWFVTQKNLDETNRYNVCIYHNGGYTVYVCI